MTARIGGGAARLDVSTAAFAFADDQWHHTAVVLDRAVQRLRLYLDGEPAALAVAAGSCGVLATPDTVDTSACPAAVGDTTAPFVIGTGLAGAVDEVQLVRFALTGDQVAVLAGANGITIDARDVRAATRRTAYGLLLEDISHSVDGGIYAELVRNRTFKEAYQPGSGPSAGPVPYWSLVTGGGATGCRRCAAAPEGVAVGQPVRRPVGRVEAQLSHIERELVEPQPPVSGSTSLSAASACPICCTASCRSTLEPSLPRVDAHTAAYRSEQGPRRRRSRPHRRDAQVALTRAT